MLHRHGVHVHWRPLRNLLVRPKHSPLPTLTHSFTRTHTFTHTHTLIHTHTLSRRPLSQLHSLPMKPRTRRHDHNRKPVQVHRHAHQARVGICPTSYSMSACCCRSNRRHTPRVKILNHSSSSPKHPRLVRRRRHHR